MKDHEDSWNHLHPVHRQGEDGLLYRAKQKVQGFALILVHQLIEAVGQSEHQVKIRNAGDHFRLPQCDPLLLFKIATAGTAAAAAGTGPHFYTAAGPASDQRVAKLPGLTGNHGVNGLKLFLRHLMGKTVIPEMGCQEIPDGMRALVVFMRTNQSLAFGGHITL